MADNVSEISPAVTPRQSAPKQRLSICMISDDFLPAATGVGIHIQRIAPELVRRGHAVSIITTRRKGEPEFQTWHGVKVYRTFTIRMFGFYQALPSRHTIRRILAENDIDIIHYHYLGILLMRTYKAATGFKVKQFYTYHMTVDHLTQPLPMKPLRGIFFKLHVDYCNRFDCILAPSVNLLDQIRHFGIKTPAHFLSNPVVFDDFSVSGPLPSHGKFLILYVGRLNPEKNLPYLLEAFASFHNRYGKTELWIVGEGNMKSRLVSLCQDLSVAKAVKFPGFVRHEDLPQYYAASDVFVLPSLIETQGMVAMEAMRFAKPVIVTNRIVSARELVENGKNGFIVDPDSARDLEEKLILLYEDAELRKRMGEESLEKSGSYSLDHIVDQLERYYHGTT